MMIREKDQTVGMRAVDTKYGLITIRIVLRLLCNND